MYTTTQCTSIPEAFDSLFDQSLPHMESGTLHWAVVGNPTSYEDKRAAVRERFETYLHKPVTKVFYWEKDGHPISLAAGMIHPHDPQYIMWDYILYGVDAGGTKGWLHDPELIAHNKNFVLNDLGLLGYTIGCVQGASLYEYHRNNKPGISETFEVTEEETKNADYAPDTNVSLIRYRYL